MNDSTPRPASPERRSYDLQVITGETVAVGDVIRPDLWHSMTVERFEVRMRVGNPLDPLIVARGNTKVTGGGDYAGVTYPGSASFFMDDFVVVSR